MKYNLLKYSLSVWLTSVFLAPLIFLIILFFEQKTKHSPIDQELYSGLFMYPILALAELLFSFITWIIFNEIIRATIIFAVKPEIRTWLIFVAGISLTAGTCTIIFIPFGLFNIDGDYGMTYLMICNCTCIGWGTMHYKLKPVAG